MKRKLFLLLCTLLTMIGVQNVKAYQTPTADGIYYIQNVETGKFLCRGNAWGTRATVSDFGSTWKLVEDNGRYHIRVASLVGANVNQGLGDDYWMYADCSGDRDRTYTLTLISDGQYTMTGSGISMNVYAYAKDDGDKFCVAGNATLDDNMTSIEQSYWRFLSQGEYDAVIASRISTQESTVATSAGYNLADLGKTLTQLVSDVNTFANKGVQATVTATTDWTWAPEANRNGGTGTGNNLVEAFKAPGKFTKTISGLTEGIYKVSIPALFRESNNEACYSLHESGYEPAGGCYISANGNTTSVSSWASGATTNNYPNSMAEAKARIDAGAYSNELYCYVDESGNLNLEVGVPGWYEISQWVGSWFIMGDATATLYSDAVSDGDATAILATANELLDQEMDATIKTNLTNAKNTFDEARTIANYNVLHTAIVAAQASAEAYALFAQERTKALALGMSADAIAALAPDVNALKVAEYNFVTTNYQYGVALGEWTSTGTNTSAATFNNEHWSGTTHDYKNQNDGNGQGWNASSWSINFSQNVTLPAGRYVFKVAGRQASGDQVTTSLVVKKGEDVLGSVNDFPRSNNARGINKSGETAFEGDASTFANGGNGFGWEWRYVKFTLDEESTVNIAVNAVATAIHQWVSFGDYTLQADNGDVADILAYNVAKASAITVRDDAQYVNVTGSERTALVNAINADPSSDYPAARTALDNARVAFTGAKTAYDAYVAAKAEEYEDNLPYASSTKFAAIGTAQAAADATSASDAEAKTNAIISAYRKYVESNALAEGVGGIDKTNLISDANFSGVTIVGQTAGAWAFSQTGGTAAILSGESFTDGDGNANYSYFDYNNGGGNNQNLSQTLTALPKGQYLLTVTARATTAMTGNYYLSVDFDETSAKEAIPAIGNTGGIFGRGWNDVSLVFNHVSDGDVTIHVYGENGKKGWSGATRFRLVKMDQVATIGATGWTTFASAYPLDLGGMSASTGEVKAYYASSVGTGKIVMTSTTSEGVAAGTGLMLKGTAGATITIPVAISGTGIVGNMLVGCTTETPVAASETCYVLINNGGTAEFQSLKTNGATIPAGKAYLNTGVNSPARLIISFDEEDPTAINAVEAAEAETGALKDGKYLVGNKIVLVKNGVKYDANGKKLN